MKKILLSGVLSILTFIVFSSMGYANFASPATTCAGMTLISEAQCIDLLNFYNETDGDNRSSSANWGVTGSSAWFGVTMSGGNVTVISLAFNGLSGGLSTDILSNLSGLTTLTLSLNDINSIASGAFNGLSSLTNLGLGSNQISSLDNAMFSGLSSLTTLALSYNQISSIPSSTFSGLSSLTNLQIGGNQISSVASGTFNGLPSLTTLYIDNGQVSSIANGAFNGLPSLTTLNLNGNQISSIGNISFNGLSSLTSLNLADNNISSISNSVFNGLSSLTSLQLQSNEISSIADGAFNGLSSLTSLNLNTNKIISITSANLNGLSGATTVYLNTNRLSTLDANTFNALPSLVTIYLSTNCLDEIALGTPLVTTLSGYNFTNRASQKVCPTISYSPSTSTVGPVVGTVSFTGGNSGDRNTLTTNNTTGISYTWTSNGTHLFTGLSSLNNASLLLYTDDITGTVTWITTVTNNGGGGGGGSISIDNCPNGDFTSSYYDGLCGTAPTTGSIDTNTGSTTSSGNINTGSVTSGTVTTSNPDELMQAYEYAFARGITTMDTFDKANMNGILIRAHLAKMIVQYVRETTGQEPDTDLECSFPDIANQTEELQGYIKQACQLGIMGINVTSFNPNQEVTRAQFGTVLSRVLRGEQYNGGSPFYVNHLNALKNESIMNNISNPAMIELRGYVMLMMMRADINAHTNN